MTTSKRRPSYINITAANVPGGDPLLLPRTPRSISKSRRSSVVAEHVQDMLLDSLSTTATAATGSSPASSRRSSLGDIFHNSSTQLTPVLLSESTTSCSYFEHDERLSSSSETCEASAAPTAATSFDNTSYKIKNDRSSRKLDHFFGERIPRDVSVREIQREGLNVMLQSKIPLCYFLYHLLEEYSSENLFFFIEIEQYESFAYVSLVQQLATAQHIYNTYLTRNSYFEVNLDDKVRRAVTAAIQAKQVDGCFDIAKRAVYSLLESSFMRFTQSDTFQIMAMNCGEMTADYDATARNAAVRQLLLYIERQHAMIYTNPHTDVPVFASVSQTSRKRHELIKSMIHEFCRTLLGIDIAEQQRLLKQTPPPPVMKTSVSASTTRKSESKSRPTKFDFLRKKR